MKNVMIPEGYEKLAAIGIAYKGVYEASREYGILNAVYHNGSTFVSLKDAPQGEPTGDGVNWQYLAKGFVENLLTSIQATDTSGIAGTAGERLNAQSLLDVIADRVANKLIDKNKIVNELTSTDATAVLAAPQGKALKDEIGEVNRKLDGFKIHETGIYTAAYEADQYTYTFADFTIIIPINLMVRGSSDVKMLGVTHLKNTIYFRAINFNTMSEFKNSPISFSGCLLVK